MVLEFVYSCLSSDRAGFIPRLPFDPIPPKQDWESEIGSFLGTHALRLVLQFSDLSFDYILWQKQPGS
jgi:hypothetical protein